MSLKSRVEKIEERRSKVPVVVVADHEIDFSDPAEYAEQERLARDRFGLPPERSVVVLTPSDLDL